MAIRVLTVDDHPVVRAGVRSLISQDPDLQVVGEGGDGAEAIELYEALRPDVVLMDVRMPSIDGVSATRAILAFDPSARVVALTSFQGDADVYRALQAGACGYLLKDTLGPGLVDALRRAAAGERIIPPEIAERLAEFSAQEELTPREVEVLDLAARGLRNREIASAIGRTEDTVKAHLKHVMRKLGVDDRTEAVTLAARRGIIHIG